MALQDIRTKYPEYNDVNDRILLGLLHQKYYSDMPFKDFKSRVSATSVKDALQDAKLPAEKPATSTVKSITNPFGAFEVKERSFIERVKSYFRPEPQMPIAYDLPEGRKYRTLPPTREEQPLIALKNIGEYYAARYLTGRGLYIPDVVTSLVSDANSFSEALNRETGFVPTKKEEQIGSFLGFMGSLKTMGRLVGVGVTKLPIRATAQKVIGGGLTFGARATVEQASQRVAKGKAISPLSIAFETVLGLGYGLLDSAVARVKSEVAFKKFIKAHPEAKMYPKKLLIRANEAMSQWYKGLSKYIDKTGKIPVKHKNSVLKLANRIKKVYGKDLDALFGRMHGYTQQETQLAIALKEKVGVSPEAADKAVDLVRKGVPVAEVDKMLSQELIKPTAAVAGVLPDVRTDVEVAGLEDGLIAHTQVEKAKAIATQPDALEAREEALAMEDRGLEFRKALGVGKPDITKPNPYRQMPIERIREDAHQGVKLAKEALAEIDPASLIGKAAVSPATNKQKIMAHVIKDRHRLTDDQYRRALKYATGQDSIAKMSIEEADNAIRHLGNFDYTVGLTKEVAKASQVHVDPLMPKGYNTRIRKAAGSDEVFNKAVGYSHKAGGVPSNSKVPNLAWRQERYAQDIINIANIQKRAAKIAAKREPIGKDVNVINQWSSARYAMAQAGVKSGVPVRRLYSNIVASANSVRSSNAKALKAALQRAGAPKHGSPLSFKNGVKISEWLFTNPETDPGLKTSLWNDMDVKTQNIAAEVQGFLQNESAFQVRWARWIKWDRAARTADSQITKLQNKGVKLTKKRLDTIMKSVKSAKPPNAPQNALEEGRAAESSGQLLPWLGTQTWGTRKHYFMSEKELVELTKMYPTGSIPEELEKAANLIGGAPEQILPETMTREGKGKVAKGGSLLGAVMNHANRVGTFAATYDDLQNFWTAFGSTNPSPRDIASVRKLVNTSLGFRHAVEPWVKVGQRLNNVFWRTYFAFSPKRSGWFAFRNFHQNVAYGLSQTEMKEAAKSASSLSKILGRAGSRSQWHAVIDKVNPWIREDYANHWESRISQRKQLHLQFILQKQGGIVSDFGNRAVSIIDALGSLPIYSDEINRLQAWPIMHQTAYRNVQQLIGGKISAKKFWTNLNMDTLHVDQRVEMHRLMDAGKWRKLVNNYSEYKTENIHGRYDTALRSVAEQTPGGRLAIGLATFPRLTFEIMYQNGLKPFTQGYESGNYRQSYEGLKTMMMGVVGSRAARWMLAATTGRLAYGIFDTVFRYTPVAPGPRRMQELADVVNETLWRADEQGLDVTKTADAIIGATVYQTELLIPLCDVMIDALEARDDVQGVRLYDLIKNKALERFYDETGKEFRPASRDTMEMYHHLFWGGAEEGKELKERKEWKRERQR